MKHSKKTFTLLILLIVGKLALSQLNVINTFPTNGIRYEDGWKATISNPVSTQSVYAELEITKNNQTYLKAISEQFMLTAGITNIDFNKFKGIQIQLNAQNVFWNQFLTFGQYEICLRIHSFEQGVKGEGCAPVVIMPVSPPVVISPENDAEVGFNPVFSWAPPVPMNIFKSICYQLKVVPVYQGQSGYEAMSRNNPVLNEPCLSSLSFIYNISNLPLEEGVSYAWQITAMDEGTEVGKSEVQTMKVKSNKEKPKEILIPKYYYKLRKTEDGNFGTVSGCIGFTCEEERLDSNMKFEIFNPMGKLVSCNDKLKLTKIGEENYFIIDLSGCYEFKSGNIYRLEVRGATNQKYMLSFKYSNQD